MVYNGTIQTHSVDNTLGNPNLKPELHTETEFGLEGNYSTTN
jgi:outer membrane receptor protein involved in Fe transport